jgi:hypothetical protein
VHHAAPVVFSVDFDGGEHVYRVHPIYIQLVKDPVIKPRDILHCHVERRAEDYAIVEGFTPRNISFLVMNSDFRFVLAMDVIGCTAGLGNVLLTSVCTSPTALEAEVL